MSYPRLLEKVLSGGGRRVNAHAGRLDTAVSTLGDSGGEAAAITTKKDIRL
jgi:hypothetical protein